MDFSKCRYFVMSYTHVQHQVASEIETLNGYRYLLFKQVVVTVHCVCSI